MRNQSPEISTAKPISWKLNPRTLLLASIVFLVVCCSIDVYTRGQNRDQTGDVARGKYLVEEVAKCSECHTPRDSAGNLDAHAWLQGAPVWITPVHPIKDWADTVPPIAGLPNLTDVQMERVLEKGTGPEGEVLRPPMHVYRMNHADAQAIVAYLKTLPPAAH